MFTTATRFCYLPTAIPYSSLGSSVLSVSRNSSQKCAVKMPTVSTSAENICHCQRPSRTRMLNSHKKVPMMMIRLANFSIFIRYTLFANRYQRTTLPPLIRWCRDGLELPCCRFVCSFRSTAFMEFCSDIDAERPPNQKLFPQ